MAESQFRKLRSDPRGEMSAAEAQDQQAEMNTARLRAARLERDAGTGEAKKRKTAAKPMRKGVGSY
jgi:hypothetical protein